MAARPSLFMYLPFLIHVMPGIWYYENIIWYVDCELLISMELLTLARKVRRTRPPRTQLDGSYKLQASCCTAVTNILLVRQLQTSCLHGSYKHLAARQLQTFCLRGSYKHPAARNIYEYFAYTSLLSPFQYFRLPRASQEAFCGTVQSTARAQGDPSYPHHYCCAPSRCPI